MKKAKKGIKKPIGEVQGSYLWPKLPPEIIETFIRKRGTPVHDFTECGKDLFVLVMLSRAMYRVAENCASYGYGSEECLVTAAKMLLDAAQTCSLNRGTGEYHSYSINARKKINKTWAPKAKVPQAKRSAKRQPAAKAPRKGRT